MDNDHDITGELREWAEDALMRLSAHEELLAIADRIDARYERMFRSLTIDAEPMTDESMAEHGWVRLPVDAEGKPWHIGDFTESGQLVYKMYLDVNGWSFYGLVNDIDPSIHRHYHEPTVEDVLHELIGKALMLSEIDGENELVAEYAKRLRLASDAE